MINRKLVIAIATLLLLFANSYSFATGSWKTYEIDKKSFLVNLGSGLKHDQLLCPFCSQINLNPVHDCSQNDICCNDCFATNQFSFCIGCGEQLSLTTESSLSLNVFKKKIHNLPAICTECGWAGMLLDAPLHAKGSCVPEAEMPCPYNPWCSKKLSKEQMASHIDSCVYRVEVCDLCCSEVAHLQMSTHQAEHKADRLPGNLLTDRNTLSNYFGDLYKEDETESSTYYWVIPANELDQLMSGQVASLCSSSPILFFNGDQGEVYFTLDRSGDLCLISDPVLEMGSCKDLFSITVYTSYSMKDGILHVGSFNSYGSVVHNSDSKVVITPVLQQSETMKGFMQQCGDSNYSKYFVIAIDTKAI
ncbi:hypothetical protein [Spongorhabdus nitratireducens]